MMIQLGRVIYFHADNWPTNLDSITKKLLTSLKKSASARHLEFDNEPRLIVHIPNRESSDPYDLIGSVGYKVQCRGKTSGHIQNN